MSWGKADVKMRVSILKTPKKFFKKASNQLIYHHFNLAATPEAQIQCYRPKKITALGKEFFT